MAFTKVTGPGIHTLANITSHNINSSGIITATKFVGPLEASAGSTGTFDSLTITGNVSVGGTLTYEDVTNVDSVGIITAQNGLRVTAGGVNVTAGVSTFAGAIDANGALDVDGQTDLDVLNVAETATFSALVDVNNRIDIVGGANVDQLNVAGVSTYGGNVDINANVDVSGTSTLNDDVTFTGASNNLLWDKSDNALKFSNNALAYYGSNDDLVMHHTGSTGYIKNTTGILYVQDDSNVIIGKVTGSHTGMKFIGGGALELYHNNILRVSTIAEGIDVTGRTETDLLNVSGVSTFAGNIDANGALDVDGQTDLDVLNVAETATFSSLVDVNNRLDVVGGANIDQLNVAGVTTISTGINLTAATSNLYATDGALSYYAANNAVYLNGAGASGWLRLQAAGSANDRTAINVIGHSATNGDEIYFKTNSTERLRIRDYGNVSIASSLSVTGVTTSNNYDLSAIDKSISDTAVDIFVYDTRKDSDGGAWRKRTQYTSWYNETLGSSTRGSRKEFPAVAVIVSEAAKVTIYDGDDPDLSMWMVFNQGSSDGQNRIINRFMGNLKSVSMLNGNLFIGGLSTSSADRGAGVWINFISEISYAFGSSDAQAENIYGFLFHTIAQRNTILGTDIYGDKDSKYQLANNSQCNDVAITVLPNAPIDASTGLPIPTIAVATDSGVSVIKDDGNVVDLKRTSDDDVHHVAFDNDRVLMYMELGAIYVATIPSADQSGNPNAAWSVYGTYSANTSGTNYPKIISNGSGADLVSMKDHIFATSGQNDTGNDKHRGLSILSQNLSSSGNGMVAWIKSDFNTGWMHGNCKGAFLSDTDDTNITADSLQDNSHSTLDSTFATTTGWSGQGGGSDDWSISGGVASCNGNNTQRFLYPNDSNMFDIGTSVAVEVTVSAYTSGTLDISYATGAATAGTSMTATGTYYFIGEVSGNGIVYLRSTSFVGSVDNVKMYIAEADRSENNKGLAVVGTINKTAVATGAELVSYGNFSTSNYLTQAHNSDMQTGTGDFSISCWFKTTGTDSSYEGLIFYNSAGSINDGFQLMMNNNGSDKGLYFYVYGASADVNSDYVTDLNDGNWHFSVSTYTSSQIQMYVDGELKNTKAHSTGSIANSTAQLTIGRWFGNTTAAYHFRGDLALVRHSASVPSPEQVKKMYDDEKHLFQENAKCTLYGSSNAVTAVAFDDSNDNLHAGTSGGRSDFVGLNRINNTTTAVTTAISASNGLIIEQ